MKYLPILIALLVAAAIYMYMNKQKKAVKVLKEEPVAVEVPSVKKGIIYGTRTCGYTVKQIDKYPDYTFVDCSKGDCPDFVKAYPTTEFPDGSVVTGFQ